MCPDKIIDGTEFKGERLTVQFARGPRRKDDFSGPPDRNIPRPRRTIYRMQITGLQPETSWQVRFPRSVHLHALLPWIEVFQRLVISYPNRVHFPEIMFPSTELAF